MKLCSLIVILLCSICCATAQGLPIKRSPIPIPEGEIFTRYMWKDWGLRPAQPIPDNLEDILIEKEFWMLFEFYPKIRDGELYFEFDVFGSPPDYALQFVSSPSDCILHVSTNDGFHYTVDYAKQLTVIYYDGHKVVVTEESIDKKSLPAEVKAYILTPLTEGQFYCQINECRYPIWGSIGSRRMYENVPQKVATPIVAKPIGKIELAAVKKRKIRNR